jgi:hypothetical protein
MAEVKSYKCDECGVQKMESNHWVVALPSPTPARDVYFKAWDEKVIYFKAAIHLCGEGCATKVLSRQIQAWRAQ